MLKKATFWVAFLIVVNLVLSFDNDYINTGMGKDYNIMKWNV